MRVRKGDTESFAAVELDGLSSGIDVDMPRQDLLSTFFRRRTSRLLVPLTYLIYVLPKDATSAESLTKFVIHLSRKSFSDYQQLIFKSPSFDY